MATDHYDALGISKDASADDIKRAYRKLARKLHPDINDAPDAEDRFKRISEAYAVLSDADKRRRYDAYGPEGVRDGFNEAAYERMRQGFGVGGQGFHVDLEELLRGAGFGGFRAGGFGSGGYNSAGFGGAPSGPGRDIELTLRIDFEQAIRGFQTKFRYERDVRCKACGGTGAQGQRRCPSCGGRGLVKSTKSLTIKVPKGAEEGDRLRLKGKGSDSRAGRAAGDLVITIAVDDDARLERVGLDLLVRADISPVDAMLGTTIDVQGLDGNLRARVPADFTSGKRLRLKGQGVTRGKKTGDLLVEVRIDGKGIDWNPRARELAAELREALDAGSEERAEEAESEAADDDA